MEVELRTAGVEGLELVTVSLEWRLAPPTGEDWEVIAQGPGPHWILRYFSIPKLRSRPWGG